MRFRHRDHHIFDISEAGLSEGQQHKAKHQATSKAQSSLGHAIVLHAWCSWQLSTWHLAWCLRCRGSSGALSHEDQMHGRYAQAAGQEQRGVAGHFSKTRGKPHSLRCLEKSRSWNIAWNSFEGHVDSSWQIIWCGTHLSTESISQAPHGRRNDGKLWQVTNILPSRDIRKIFCRHGIVMKQTASNGVRGTQQPCFVELISAQTVMFLKPKFPSEAHASWSSTLLKKRNAHSLGLVVDLSATPLLRNGLIHVEDVCRHVVQVLTTKIDGADRANNGFLHSWSKQNDSVHHPQSHPPKFSQCNLSLVTTSYICTFGNEYYSRYYDILRSIRRHCPSCCFMERIFGQMSPPLMDGWTSEMSCETVQSWRTHSSKGQNDLDDLERDPGREITSYITSYQLT